MNTLTPAVLEHVAADLVRRGLPIDYAQRAAAEFIDHRRDLLSELCAAGLDEVAADEEASRLLGDTRMLVEKTVREYRRRFWCGRWPLMTFLLGPLPTMCLVSLAIALILTGIAAAGDAFGVRLGPPDGKTSITELLCIEGIWCLMFALPPILVASVFLWLARRSGCGLAWGGIAGIEVALLSGLTHFDADYQHGRLQVGWPIDIPTMSGWLNWYFSSSWRHLLQFSLPLATCAIILAICLVAQSRRAKLVTC
jgi:hypothetical protein